MDAYVPFKKRTTYTHDLLSGRQDAWISFYVSVWTHVLPSRKEQHTHTHVLPSRKEQHKHTHTNTNTNTHTHNHLKQIHHAHACIYACIS